MEAVEQVARQTERCTGGPPTRPSVPHTIPANVKKAASWVISPDPIRLEHNGDVVEWSLDDLILAYPDPRTVFEIIFISAPGVLDPKLGPFKTLNRAGDKLIGTSPIGDQGCYTYNLWVTPPGMNPKKLPIDPQIDNIAPPPPPPSPYPPSPEDDGLREEREERVPASRRDWSAGSPRRVSKAAIRNQLGLTRRRRAALALIRALVRSPTRA